MHWTKERIDRIPEVYRDFIIALRSIVDSRDSVLRVAAVPLSNVYTDISARYDYSIEQVRELAGNLELRGLIRQDRLGFVELTAAGEELLKALLGELQVGAAVPEFPAF